MGIGALGFAFLAGLLSVLSPCVLPVLPLVFAPAMSAHRFGAAALAGGLVTSFVVIGLLLATVGFSLGVGNGVVRDAAAVVLGLVGLVLLSSSLQQLFAMATNGFSNRANRLMPGLTSSGPGARIGAGIGTGIGGQFCVGLLLGAVWSPCVGPTLGAASVLAAQGSDLASVAAVMIVFGLGAALPLVLVSRLSREVLLRWRGRMMQVGKSGKVLLGAASLAVSLLILSGLDRAMEMAVVEASPGWLTSLTTRF